MRSLKVFVLLLVLSGAFGCGPSGPARAAVTKRVQSRISTFDVGAVIQGKRLLQPKVVERVYAVRKGNAVWPEPDDAKQIVRAIRGMEKDGLDPADYHLAAIETLMEERDKTPTADVAADLDILLTDAVAAMLDHVRYGRVRPSSLDPHWNVDPRENAPPLEEEVARIAAAPSIETAIEGAKPDHFIYRGLKGALAELRDVEAKGGWPRVPPGKAVRPGTSNPRVPAIRARLAASGELRAQGRSASTVYDPELRRAVEEFQARHRIEAKGVIDKVTVDAMNVSAGERVAQLRVNLERARWVLGGLQGDFLLVNLPAFKAYLIRGGKNVWEARTQIGEDAMQTPAFRAEMQTIVFNPDWTVPPTILAEEVLEGMRKDESYLARKELVLFDKDNQQVDASSVDWGSANADDFPYTVRQLPGEGNALGQVKFLFPNKYSIYLHDTPNKRQFESGQRTFSHGCIRLENPLELAEILLEGQGGWTSAKIAETVQSDTTVNVELRNRLPVLIVYWTVSVGANGEVRYMKDIYNLDPPVLAALGATPRRA